MKSLAQGRPKDIQTKSVKTSETVIAKSLRIQQSQRRDGVIFFQTGKTQLIPQGRWRAASLVLKPLKKGAILFREVEMHKRKIVEQIDQ